MPLRISLWVGLAAVAVSMSGISLAGTTPVAVTLSASTNASILGQPVLARRCNRQRDVL